jgi:hypothetical protein
MVLASIDTQYFEANIASEHVQGYDTSYNDFTIPRHHYTNCRKSRKRVHA